MTENVVRIAKPAVPCLALAEHPVNAASGEADDGHNASDLHRALYTSLQGRARKKQHVWRCKPGEATGSRNPPQGSTQSPAPPAVHHSRGGRPSCELRCTPKPCRSPSHANGSVSKHAPRPAGTALVCTDRPEAGCTGLMMMRSTTWSDRHREPPLSRPVRSVSLQSSGT